MFPLLPLRERLSRLSSPLLPAAFIGRSLETLLLPYLSRAAVLRPNASLFTGGGALGGGDLLKDGSGCLRLRRTRLPPTPAGGGDGLSCRPIAGAGGGLRDAGLPRESSRTGLKLGGGLPLLKLGGGLPLKARLAERVIERIGERIGEDLRGPRCTLAPRMAGGNAKLTYT